MRLFPAPVDFPPWYAHVPFKHENCLSVFPLWAPLCLFDSWFPISLSYNASTEIRKIIFWNYLNRSKMWRWSLAIRYSITKPVSLIAYTSGIQSGTKGNSMKLVMAMRSVIRKSNLLRQIETTKRRLSKSSSGEAAEYELVLIALRQQVRLLSA